MGREVDYIGDLCLGLHSIEHPFLVGENEVRDTVSRFRIRRSTVRKRVESKTLPNSTFSVFPSQSRSINDAVHHMTVMPVVRAHAQ
jgi:hypothetical protein